MSGVDPLLLGNGSKKSSLKLGGISVTLTPRPVLSIMVGNADPGVVDKTAGGNSVLISSVALAVEVDFCNKLSFALGKLFSLLISMRLRIVGISGLLDAGINEEGNAFSSDKIFGFLLEVNVG